MKEVQELTREELEAELVRSRIRLEELEAELEEEGDEDHEAEDAGFDPD